VLDNSFHDTLEADVGRLKMSIKIGTWAVAVILVMGPLGFASAQENSTMKPTIHHSTRAVTGCLQNGDDEYVLLADDGDIWELKSNSVKLDGQIGHTVIVSGVVSDPAMHSTTVNTNDKMKEQGGYRYMTVSKLTVLSNTCEING
jgi:hypothetical protein